MLLNKIHLKKQIVIVLLLNFLVTVCYSEAPKISVKEYNIRVTAEKLQKEGKTKEAIAVINEWAEKSKKEMHPNLYEYRGSLLAHINDYKKAKDDYFKAYEIYPTVHNVTSLGYCHLNLEDFFVAENVFRAAMIKYPGNQTLKKGLLQCLFHQKRTTEALALVNSLLIKNDTDVELLQLLGQIHWQLGEYQKAFENYQYIYLLNKAEEKHLYALLDLSLVLKLPKRAIVYAEEILKKSKKIDSQRAESLGLVFLNKKAFLSAEKWIRLALKHAKKKMKKEYLLIYLADAIKSSDLQNAKKILAEVKDPLVKNGRYYFLLGSLYATDKKSTKAISYFLEAKTYETYRKPSLWKLYGLYQSSNDSGNCLKILFQLKTLEPENKTIKKLISHYSQ